MSRYYGMSVTIKGYIPAMEDHIIAACNSEWPFDDDWSSAESDKDTLHASSNDFLFGGESEEQFVERLSKAVWKANGKYCKVNILASCLEEPPTEEYELTSKDYKKLMSKKAKSS